MKRVCGLALEVFLRRRFRLAELDLNVSQLGSAATRVDVGFSAVSTGLIEPLETKMILIGFFLFISFSSLSCQIWVHVLFFSKAASLSAVV